MATWYVSAATGAIYQGDMAIGDSIATSAQVTAWAAAHPVMPTSVTITSTGTPSLSGTYPIDHDTLSTLNGEASYIAINSAFSSGTSTLPWPDTSGVLHTFSSTAEFIAFASAVTKYVTQATMAIQTSGTMPSSPVTIP